MWPKKETILRANKGFSPIHIRSLHPLLFFVETPPNLPPSQTFFYVLLLTSVRSLAASLSSSVLAASFLSE